jgi:hypothetical protein
MKIKNLIQTCIACPSQWEAMTEDNRPVYIRYRWGTLQVTVGMPGDKHVLSENSRQVLNLDLGRGEFDGVISYNEIKEYIDKIDLEKDFYNFDKSISMR